MFQLNKAFFEHDIVFISGLARSGKGLLCPIVSSFENTDKINLEPNFETLLELKHIDCIEENTLIYLLRSHMNLMIYNDAIGRNVNYRPDDYTSVWNYSDPLMYIHRMKIPEGDEVYQSIKKSNRLFPLMLHDGLLHADYILKAFPSSKLIHMQRHPIDLAYSWLTKGFGGSSYSNLRTHMLTYEFNNMALPYYTFGWEEQFISLNEGDRVIHMISNLLNMQLDRFNQLEKKNKNKVLFVNHQVLATNPSEVIGNLEFFLDSKTSPHTERVLERENCPRNFVDSDRIEKLQSIQSQSTNEGISLLHSMIDKYNNSSII
jgi:hypothetical protein